MTLHLETPQLVCVALMISGLMLTARNHGKPRTPENFWAALTAQCITLGLLAWGGFFR